MSGSDTARRRRPWPAVRMAVVAVLVASATTVVTQGSAYAVTIDPNAWYQVVSRHSGMALAIGGASTADGAGLVQTTAGSATNQQFQFVDSGGGFYRLRAR